MRTNVKGFTLIELLVVIGIIGILAAIVLVAVNPGRQFAQARDTQRRSDLLAITNTLYQFAAEHDGNLPAVNYDASGNGDFPDCANDGQTIIGSDGFDLAIAGAIDPAVVLPAQADTDLIVPTYIADIPSDPSTGSLTDTGYTMCVDTGRVTAEAVGELTGTITVER